MRAQSLLLVAPRRLVWTTAELPSLGARDLLVETRVGAVSIGTELPLYRGDSRNSAPATYPRMTGYESVGTVIARGADVRDAQFGDRVVATYGHRDFAVVPEPNVIVVPPVLSDELALLAILCCDVAAGIAKLGEGTREPVLVTGAGAIGLLALFVLLQGGTPAVDVLEPRPERRAAARRFGAREVIDPSSAERLAEPYAAGLECSSRDAAFATLQGQMRHGGRICVLADGNREPLTLTPPFHERELTIVGSSDSPDYQGHAQWYFGVAPDAAKPLASLFDLVVAADELPATFERLATGAASAIKVLIRYR